MSDPKRVRVNVRTDAGKVRHEQRAGRDVIVVQSATLPDDIIMNGIRYPAEEIERSYRSLEGTPAPLGHPMINGEFIPALAPIAINMCYFGAWNENVDRRDGRVWVDKVIDVERANESEMGRRVLDAIDKGEPIHTSTGLVLSLRESEHEGAEWDGYDFEFDHDAILLDEDGAATPDQGVGMMVNSARDSHGELIDALASEIHEGRERSSDDGESMVTRLRRLLGITGSESIGNSKEENAMSEDKDAPDAGAMMERVSKLEARLAQLEESMTNMMETVENMGKKTEEYAEAVNAINAERSAARDKLVQEVVKAELMSEEAAWAVGEFALRELVAAHNRANKVQPAPGIAGGYAPQDDSVVDFAEDWEKED